MVNKLLLFSLLLSSGACSLYASDGRKYLEKNAFQFARSASVNQQGCGTEAMNGDWLKTSENESAEVFSNDLLDFTIRIVPRTSDGSYHCTFKFSSVQEMIERTDSAVNLTVEQMALGLVP